MHQRTTSLWNLAKGHELIDLEGRFCGALLFLRRLFPCAGRGTLDHPWSLSNGNQMAPKFSSVVAKNLFYSHLAPFRELPLEIFDEETLVYMGDLVG